jgi:hypothetical protein
MSIPGLIEWIVTNGGEIRHSGSMMWGKVHNVRWRYFIDITDPDSDETYACVETNGSFEEVIACFTLGDELGE